MIEITRISEKLQLFIVRPTINYLYLVVEPLFIEPLFISIPPHFFAPIIENHVLGSFINPIQNRNHNLQAKDFKSCAENVIPVAEECKK